MIPEPGESGGAAELRQVLHALALARIPGWNFPGHFLGLSFDEVSDDESLLSLEPGPHCVARNGEQSLGAIAVLADVALAACMRRRIGLATRMATVAMSLQFTGVRPEGRLEARGCFDGFLAGAKGRQGMMRLEVRAGGRLVCTGSGSFMALGTPPGAAPLPMFPRHEQQAVEPLVPAQLRDDEQRVYQRALDAVADSGADSFFDRFVGLIARHHAGGASCEFDNGLHVGNRVGHTQGGLTWALAMITAAAALEGSWRLAGASAGYIAPGTGPKLFAEAQVLHEGGLTAVVRARVLDSAGRTVLELLSNYSRGAA